MRNHPQRIGAALIAAACVVGALTATDTATATTPAPEGSTAAQPRLAFGKPLLSLKKAVDQVTLRRYGRSVYLDLGVYVVAGPTGFEVRAKRPVYSKPIQARLLRPSGDRVLPAGLITNFRSLGHFTHVRITDAKGHVVYHKQVGFCPNSEAVRVSPESPDRSHYPLECPYNPYTRGAVYGIERGYGVPALSPYGVRARLPVGRLTATMWIDRDYRKAFGLAAEPSAVQMRVRVVERSGQCAEFGCKTASSPVERTHHSYRPAASEPTGRDTIPQRLSRPDLRSLPAFAVRLNRKGYLSFAANVWNAGPSPLVIDGFRRADENVMDAYQYFYDADGNPAGHSRAGTMKWDARRGHHHWHFTNFARYRLLDADKQLVVRSRKQAFCLADTDAVDYTVAGANWRPWNTDLHTACGGITALSVREVLDAGSGDTYYQSLPGQSFRVKGLPNGVYYIAVEANPVGRLHETRTDNNVSYRKVILGGTPQDHTVRVPQVGMVKESGRFF